MILSLLEELDELALRLAVAKDVETFLELCEEDRDKIDDDELSDVAHFFWYQRGAAGFFTEDECEFLDVLVEDAFYGDVLVEDVDMLLERTLVKMTKARMSRARTRWKQPGALGRLAGVAKRAVGAVGRGAAAVGRRAVSTGQAAKHKVGRAVRGYRATQTRKVRHAVRGVRKAVGGALQRAGAGLTRAGGSVAHRPRAQHTRSAPAAAAPARVAPAAMKKRSAVGARVARPSPTTGRVRLKKKPKKLLSVSRSVQRGVSGSQMQTAHSASKTRSLMGGRKGARATQVRAMGKRAAKAGVSRQSNKLRAMRAAATLPRAA